MTEIEFPNIDARLTSLEETVDRLEQYIIEIMESRSPSTTVQKIEPEMVYHVTAPDGDVVRCRMVEVMPRGNYRFEYLDKAGFAVVNERSVDEQDRKNLPRPL